MTRFIVRTRDVDGSSKRVYSTLVGAAKRFEEMSGFTMEQAIAEQFYYLEDEGKIPPTVEEVKRLKAVSNFGTVVSFEKI